MDLKNLTTEQRNEKTMSFDELPICEALRIMNKEDQNVALAVSEALPIIEEVIRQIIKCFNKKGRLIYMGAGTSGRLGILDAAECVPTFSVDDTMVQGLIAGGIKAMTVAVEGAEDSKELGVSDLKNINLTSNDILVGIAASGRTPYVIGGLKYAREVGAVTATIACNNNAEISKFSDYPIEINVGSEVLTGSTRLKSGTAQKLVLNMLSTISMVGIGKVYKNLMVDVKPTNEKLVERSKNIIMQATDCSYETASQKFYEANQNVKLAIVMILTNCSNEEASKRLDLGNGFVRKALQ